MSTKPEALDMTPEFIPGNTVPPAVRVSSTIWLLIGVLGTVSACANLLLILAFSGLVGPGTYFPPLLFYVVNAVGAVAAGVLALLMRQGRWWPRVFLTAYPASIPVLFLLPGGPAVGGIPWPQLLMSPLSAVIVAVVVASVLMWLPSASQYFNRTAVGLPDGVLPGSATRAAGMPASIEASLWVLFVAGIVAGLQALLGLVFVAAMSGSVSAPALALWLTLAVVAAADVVCALQVRRRRRWVRPAVTLLPVIGLIAIVLAVITGMASPPPGNPTPGGGVLPMVFATILAQGLSLIAGLVPAVLVWVPSARGYLHRSHR